MLILALSACNSPYGNVVNLEVAARIDKGEEGSIISCCINRVDELCTKELWGRPTPLTEAGPEKLFVPEDERLDSFDGVRDILLSSFVLRKLLWWLVVVVLVVWSLPVEGGV